jgi:hypothetical protein
MMEAQFPRRHLLKLSDKSEQSLVWGSTSGHNGARKPCFAVCYLKNVWSRSPPAIYQTVSLGSSVNSPV